MFFFRKKRRMAETEAKARAFLESAFGGSEQDFPEEVSVHYSVKDDSALWGQLRSARRGSVDLSRFDASMRTVMEKTFTEQLLELIIKSGQKESRVYKAAQIDRRLFSQIMKDKYYRPSKDTVLSFAFALGLDLAGAEDLLRRAGYSLSRSSKQDVVLEYCFREGIHDIIEINDLLDRLGLRTLGRQGK